jgi:carbon storage regulator CsrA
LTVGGEGPQPTALRRWTVLVLSRKENESIVVPGCRIEIVVREISGDKVRIGIRAPDEVDIYRHEVWQQMCFEEWTRKQGDDNDTEDHEG